jgi:hypothetical protein
MSKASLKVCPIHIHSRLRLNGNTGKYLELNIVFSFNWSSSAMRRTTKAGIIVIATIMTGDGDKVRNLWEGYVPMMSVSQRFSTPQSIAVERSPSAEYPAQIHASSHVRHSLNLHCSCSLAVDDCNKKGRYVVRNLSHQMAIWILRVYLKHRSKKVLPSPSSPFTKV